MGLLFPQSQLDVTSYNRCVSTIGSLNAAEFLAKVKLSDWHTVMLGICVSADSMWAQ